MTYDEIRLALEAELSARATFKMPTTLDPAACLIRFQDAATTMTVLRAAAPYPSVLALDKHNLQEMWFETLCDGITCILTVGKVAMDGLPSQPVGTAAQVLEALEQSVIELHRKLLLRASPSWLATGGDHLAPTRPDIYLLLFDKNCHDAAEAWTTLTTCTAESANSGHVTMLSIQAATAAIITCLLTCY